MFTARSRLVALVGAWCPASMAAEIRHELSETDAALGWCAHQRDILRATNGGGLDVEGVGSTGSTTAFLKEERKRLEQHQLIGPATSRGLFLQAAPRKMLRGIEGVWLQRTRLLRPVERDKEFKKIHGYHPKLEAQSPRGSAALLEHAASEPLPAAFAPGFVRQRQLASPAAVGSTNEGSAMTGTLSAFNGWTKDIRGPGPLVRHCSSGVRRLCFPDPPESARVHRAGSKVHASAAPQRRLCVA